MKQLICSVILCLTLLSVSYSQNNISVNKENYVKIKDKWYVIDKKSGANYLVNEKYISIKFKQEEVSIASGLNFLKTEGLNLKVMRRSKTGWLDMEVPSGTNVFDLVTRLSNIKIIKEVKINSYGTLDYTPNDDNYSQQWHLPKIHANSAWDYYTGGNSNIVIAILDCGTDWTHEDLGTGSDNYQNIWLNPGEDAWTTVNDPSTGNDVDNDGNGYVDDWKGWDFIDNDNDSRSPDLSHGTSVAGIASAKTNNDRGVAGVAGGSNNSGVKLMILRVAFNYFGTGVVDFGVVDDAIDYAVAKGAKVINMSFGGPTDSGVSDAIEDAYHNHGVVFVASSGNYPPGTSSIRFPASADHVIAVGSTSTNDSKSDFSCYGSEMDISAPGEDIYTTLIGNNYGNAGDGTSFAAPQVSAVAALLKSINQNLTPDEIRTILISTADKVGGYNYNGDQNHPGHSSELGYGRLNVANAIAEIFPFIDGPDYVCSSGTDFILKNLPTGSTITWSSSAGISRVSAQGSDTCIFETNDNGGYGWINATITYNNLQYEIKEKVVWEGLPNPTSGIFYREDQEFCVYEDINFWTDLYYDNLPDTYYEWSILGYLNANISSGQGTISPMIYSYDPGYMTLSVTARNGCGYAQTVYSQNDEFYFDYCFKKLNLFPNPAADYITIQLESDPIEISIIDIYDSQSRKVMSTTLTSREKTIDISGLPKGLYYLTAFKKGKVITEKFIKK